MFKNIISPVQAWLLSQGRCVGCGKPLNKAKISKRHGKDVVTCTCKRIYVYDSSQKQYRRALFTEL